VRSSVHLLLCSHFPTIFIWFLALVLHHLEIGSGSRASMRTDQTEIVDASENVTQHLLPAFVLVCFGYGGLVFCGRACVASCDQLEKVSFNGSRLGREGEAVWPYDDFLL